MKQTIKELPESSRPYEKCLQGGPSVLSDSELLAVILRSGVPGNNSLALANQILSLTKDTSYPGLLGLMHMSLPDLMKVNGIGKVKAIQLKCIGELSKRMASAVARPGLSFNDPITIAKYYMEHLRHEEQEVLIVMLLDGKNHLIGEQTLSRGTVNATLITPREIFLEAMKFHAVSVILVHNHPSGDPTPSDDDIKVTERVYRSGELLGVRLLDHVVIGDHKYVSFRELGLLAYEKQ
nr:DNA repair protein RadC [uncultured Blautia sp.]